MGRVIKKKLAESVLDEISRMVESGELKEGDKLPNQNELAAQLGVSRPSLREALKILEDIGAIEQRPKYGTVFKGRSQILYSSHLTPPLLEDEAAVIELIEARKFIEMACVELAAVKATDREIEELGRLVEKMEEMLDRAKMDQYAEHDITFHYSIARASGNRFMHHLFVSNRRLMEHIIEDGFRLLPGMFDRSRRYHQGIYQALKARDKAKAVEIMGEHIDFIMSSLKALYESGGRDQERVLRSA